jgi:hypothetical protein
MSLDLTKIDLIGSIEGNFDYHAFMGKQWRMLGSKDRLAKPLLYAAIEYRLAIERFVFELYYLINKENLFKGKEVDDKQLKRIERYKSLVSVLYEDAGNKEILRRVLLYNKIHFSILVNANFNLSIPDISILDRYWHKLSDICHFQHKPLETWLASNWISEGYNLLKDIEHYIFELVIKNKKGYVQPSTMPLELQELRNQFISGKVNEEQLKVRLNLMKPVIGNR